MHNKINDTNKSPIISHSLAACLTLFLIHAGKMGCIQVPNHNLPGIYTSFCPFCMLAIITSAVFSADYCLFLESCDTCLDPIISLFLMGVSRLVGYTIHTDICYY